MSAENPCAPEDANTVNRTAIEDSWIDLTTAVVLKIDEGYPSQGINRRITLEMNSNFLCESRRKARHPDSERHSFLYPYRNISIGNVKNTILYSYPPGR